MGKGFNLPLFLLFRRKHDERSHRGSNPPDTKAPVTFPPKLLDKILEHIPTNREGRQTLIACALVATWWVKPSQRRLFYSVELHEIAYRRWMKGVVLPGSKTHLLEHVRSLWHSRDLGYRMRDLARDSGEYLPALRNLHSLTFFSIKVEHISEDQFHTCFSAFRETLTYLSLESFTTSFSAFVALIDYFPNITTLQLCSGVLELDEGQVPSLSRPLRGKLRLRDLDANFLGFFNRFIELDMEYEELVIGSSSLYLTEAKLLESALQICKNTVRSVGLTDMFLPATAAAIRNYRQLRVLELMANRPNSSHEVPLSSITSTELRKIVFWTANVNQAEEWAFIDEQLCGLVNRLRAMGYRRTLEVELRLMKVEDGAGGYDFTLFLPKFREKGVVTIVDVARGNRVLDSSIHER